MQTENTADGGSPLVPNIRASMLPGSQDCMRKAAAQQYRELIESKGYQLRQVNQSIGGVIGTGLHAAAAELLRIRKENEQPGFSRDDIKAARDLAMEGDPDRKIYGLLQSIKDGVEWDETAGSVDDAAQHLERMLLASAPYMLGMIPAEIERKLIAPLPNEDGEIVALGTGHIDELEETGMLWDWKTGAHEPSPIAQIGFYIMLAQANALDVTGAGMLYFKRGSLRKPQADPIKRVFDLVEATEAAYSAAHGVARSVREFDITGDPWAFRANPMSQMCTPAYCCAHSTPFCKVGKGARK